MKEGFNETKIFSASFRLYIALLANIRKKLFSVDYNLLTKPVMRKRKWGYLSFYKALTFMINYKKVKERIFERV